MKLESLPNEILIACFEYLNALDIFHSFDQLNQRFNTLIRVTRFYLSFEQTGESTFNQFCRKILQSPDVTEQIYALHLSNKNVANQIRTFLTHFSLDQFPQLRSLTFTGVREEQAECLRSLLPFIPQLSAVHLIRPEKSVTNILMKRPMSKLRTLAVTDSCQYLETLDQTSFITHLTTTQCCLSSLTRVLRKMPLLKYLNCDNIVRSTGSWNYPIDYEDYQCLYLKQLVLTNSSCRIEDLHMLIQRTPNLKSFILTADHEREMIDARRWEQLITSSFSQLTQFQFKFQISRRKDNDSDILGKFEEFQTSFWREEHQWFVNFILRDYLIEIYTTPYIINTFTLTNDLIGYSKNQSNTFDNVTDLIIDDQGITEDFTYRFSKVISLTLRPLTHTWNKNHVDRLTSEYIQSLKKTVSLSNIKHLDISENDQMGMSCVLLEIFKQASYLSSLKIAPYLLKSILDNDDLQKYLNKMIRKLTVSGYSHYIFSDSNRIRRFCKIFSNLVELRWEGCASVDLLCLKDRLLNLSILESN